MIIRNTINFMDEHFELDIWIYLKRYSLEDLIYNVCPLTKDWRKKP